MWKKILFLLCSFILLVTSILYCADDIRFANQEPKGDTMDLVPYTQKMMDFPFIIKYPAKWYVREEFAGVPSLFLTREPVRDMTDKYLVGMGLYYSINYFVSKEPTGSPLGKTAGAVIKVIDWDKSKKELVKSIKDQGNKILSQSDMEITGQPILRVEYESQNLHAIVLYIKVNAHLLIITFEAPPQEYEQYKDIFEDMIKSFSFTR